MHSSVLNLGSQGHNQAASCFQATLNMSVACNDAGQLRAD